MKKGFCRKAFEKKVTVKFFEVPLIQPKNCITSQTLHHPNQHPTVPGVWDEEGATCNKVLPASVEHTNGVTNSLCWLSDAISRFGWESSRSCTIVRRTMWHARFRRWPQVPKVYIAAIVLTRTASNVLVNLSLKYNTVGTYQLLKMLNVPFVFLGEWMFMGSPLQASIAISLAVLCAGIGTATMGNVVSFSFLGTVFGCLAPIAGAANVLFIKHVQSEFDLLGNDLLKVWHVVM